MPTNTTIFNIPKPLTSEVFNLTNFNTILDAIESGVSSKVQMTKITDDTGGVEINATNTTDDILALILAQGKGIQTFYNVANAVNNPAGNASIRGISHFTATNTGWVHATDANNNVYTNSCDLGTWKGWNKFATDKAPSWTPLTLQNGATVYNTRTPRYSKSGNIVTLQGEISMVADGTVIGTLPATFRPGAWSLNFITPIATSTAMQTALVSVATDGKITVQTKTSGATSGIVLNGITFPAEQ
jgi:hypothetical protein